MQRQGGVSRDAGRWEPAFEFGIGVLGLAVTWWLLFMWVAAGTEGWLVPWDTTSLRPTSGTWQRAVNDFFEGQPGSLLPSWAILAISAGLFVARLVRDRDRRWLPWSFAATNLAYLLVEPVGTGLAWYLPALDPLRAPGGVSQIGYQHTWAPLVVSLLLLFALLLVQGTLRVEQQELAPGKVRRGIHLWWDRRGPNVVI